mgnify:CR=1
MTLAACVLTIPEEPLLMDINGVVVFFWWLESRREINLQKFLYKATSQVN